jgi:hypothetical protein
MELISRSALFFYKIHIYLVLSWLMIVLLNSYIYYTNLLPRTTQDVIYMITLETKKNKLKFE